MRTGSLSDLAANDVGGRARGEVWSAYAAGRASPQELPYRAHFASHVRKKVRFSAIGNARAPSNSASPIWAFCDGAQSFLRAEISNAPCPNQISRKPLELGVRGRQARDGEFPPLHSPRHSRALWDANSGPSEGLWRSDAGTACAKNSKALLGEPRKRHASE